MNTTFCNFRDLNNFFQKLESQLLVKKNNGILIFFKFL